MTKQDRRKETAKCSQQRIATAAAAELTAARSWSLRPSVRSLSVQAPFTRIDGIKSFTSCEAWNEVVTPWLAPMQAIAAAVALPLSDRAPSPHCSSVVLIQLRSSDPLDRHGVLHLPHAGRESRAGRNGSQEHPRAHSASARNQSQSAHLPALCQSAITSSNADSGLHSWAQARELSVEAVTDCSIGCCCNCFLCSVYYLTLDFSAAVSGCSVHAKRSYCCD